MSKETFKLNNPTYGDHGGGTGRAIYFDKNGNLIPYSKTKWAKLAKKNKLFNFLKKGKS